MVYLIVFVLLTFLFILFMENMIAASHRSKEQILSYNKKQMELDTYLALYDRVYSQIAIEHKVKRSFTVLINSIEFYIWRLEDELMLFPLERGMFELMYMQEQRQSLDSRGSFETDELKKLDASTPAIRDLLWYDAFTEMPPLFFEQSREFEDVRLPQLIVIPLSCVKHFHNIGEVSYENKIVSEKGSPIGGAILGGLIAGHTGAIVGAMSETGNVNSELIEHDSRETIMVVKSGELIKTLKMRYEDFDVLNELIPEKHYEIVFAIRKALYVTDAVKQSQVDPVTRIKELSVLRDEGILSEEEYIVKSTEILKKIC